MGNGPPLWGQVPDSEVFDSKKWPRKTWKKKWMHPSFSWAVTSTSLDPAPFITFLPPKTLLGRIPCCIAAEELLAREGLDDESAIRRKQEEFSRLGIGGHRPAPWLCQWLEGGADPAYVATSPMSCTLERSGPRIATPLREKRRYLRKERYTSPFGIPFGI